MQLEDNLDRRQSIM